jgi:hypothetical protein
LSLSIPANQKKNKEEKQPSHAAKPRSQATQPSRAAKPRRSSPINPDRSLSIGLGSPLTDVIVSVQPKSNLQQIRSASPSLLLSVTSPFTEASSTLHRRRPRLQPGRPSLASSLRLRHCLVLQEAPIGQRSFDPDLQISTRLPSSRPKTRSNLGPNKKKKKGDFYHFW